MVGLTDIAADPYRATGKGPASGPNTYEKWVALVKRAARLPAEVPREIADVFEACVGAVMCGWVYQPLLVLGTDKVVTLRESLARAACQRHGATTGMTRRFADCIAYLFTHGLLPPERRATWELDQRGWSLPERGTPDHALRFIKAFAQDARILFPAAALAPACSRRSIA